MATLNIDIPAADLQKLKAALPKGAIEDIAEDTKYHRNFVSLLLNGGAQVTSDNIKIVHAAQKIIRMQNERSEKETASIKKTLEQ